jgi:hypothetical protein
MLAWFGIFVCSEATLPVESMSVQNDVQLWQAGPRPDRYSYLLLLCAPGCLHSHVRDKLSLPIASISYSLQPLAFPLHLKKS